MSEVLSLATLRTLVDKWIADGRRVAGPRWSMIDCFTTGSTRPAKWLSTARRGPRRLL